MAQKNGEYLHKDEEVPSWLEDITKEMKETHIQNNSRESSPTFNELAKYGISKLESNRLTRRTSLDTSMDLLVKPHVHSTAHSAGTFRNHNKSNQNVRRNYARSSLDWDDSPNGSRSNDFLSDLLLHYVTPRHRRMPCDARDDDFHDVIIGTRREPARLRRQSSIKETVDQRQNNNSNFRIPPAKTNKKPSFNSLSHKNSKSKKTDFVIPELPEGRLLEIKIYSNWGDKYLVGLNGIELFDANGKPVGIDKVWTDADTGDQSKNSHGRVENVADGVVRTRDEKHAWTTPAPRGIPIALSVLLSKSCKIALLRIWNYNKSRIYSARGVRLVQIRLDDQVVFHGEIARSSGELKGPLSSFGDTILFTKDPSILEAIMSNDKNFQALLKHTEPSASFDKRPPTANDSNHNITQVTKTGHDDEKETKYVAKNVKLVLMSNWASQRHLVGLTGESKQNCFFPQQTLGHPPRPLGG
ncbi:hypothetical protein NE865_08934 [Phthorimaea operculella]|nr:hypothetical protein NE865_08934 [Phthorimaea operculella]